MAKIFFTSKTDSEILDYLNAVYLLSGNGGFMDMKAVTINMKMPLQSGSVAARAKLLEKAGLNGKIVWRWIHDKKPCAEAVEMFKKAQKEIENERREREGRAVVKDLESVNYRSNKDGECLKRIEEKLDMVLKEFGLSTPEAKENGKNE